MGFKQPSDVGEAEKLRCQQCWREPWGGEARREGSGDTSRPPAGARRHQSPSVPGIKNTSPGAEETPTSRNSSEPAAGRDEGHRARIGARRAQTSLLEAVPASKEGVTCPLRVS